MILNTAPQDTATLNNVGQVSEFSIKATAKSFSILSSGLYANKIRAIVRELSCNAYDSHVGAGKKDVPFEVHLPNVIEPWFAVRDFGLGLSNEQVLKLYTTYFESTKTTSNDFVGALGLGSKSPFSYTNNFTVTAIKDGVRRIYTAFINDYGVPSIVEMSNNVTDECNGVEVRFSVNKSSDFYAFAEEAQYVFTYFPTKPNVIGRNDFSFNKVNYIRADIIKGVSQIAGNYNYRSIAVMGNIAYPINIPNAESALGELNKYLGCNLEMHFDIGELDFQASREGLSYIPQTISAIKNKLAQLHSALYDTFKKDIFGIQNEWERAFFIQNTAKNYLWKACVSKFIKETNYQHVSSDGLPAHSIVLNSDVLKNKFNIQVRVFRRIGRSQSIHEEFADIETIDQDIRVNTWKVLITKANKFVVNDIKIGAISRTKQYFRNKDYDQSVNDHRIFLLSAVDSNMNMDVDGFFKFVYCPPEDLIFKASTLPSVEKKAREKVKTGSITVLKDSSNSRGRASYSWVVVNEDFDDETTHYYVPLKGHEAEVFGYTDNYHIISLFNNFGEVKKLYGVRKDSIEYVKERDNWVDAREYVKKYFENVDLDKLINSCACVNSYSSIVDSVKNVVTLSTDSVFRVAHEFLKSSEKNKVHTSLNVEFISKFIPTFKEQLDKKVQLLKKHHDDVLQTYPLLNSLGWKVNESAVLDYIMLIDARNKNPT
jgi:hypothetical protein